MAARQVTSMHAGLRANLSKQCRTSRTAQFPAMTQIQRMMTMMISSQVSNVHAHGRVRCQNMSLQTHDTEIGPPHIAFHLSAGTRVMQPWWGPRTQAALRCCLLTRCNLSADSVKPLAAHNRKSGSSGRPSRSDQATPSGKGKATSSAAKQPPRKKAEPKKVAEVLPYDEQSGQAKSENVAKVDDNVLKRIKKAVALGMHSGGNPDEKKHAMQRATRLMAQHGLSQAGTHGVAVLCSRHVQGYGPQKISLASLNGMREHATACTIVVQICKLVTVMMLTVASSVSD